MLDQGPPASRFLMSCSASAVQAIQIWNSLNDSESSLAAVSVSARAAASPSVPAESMILPLRHIVPCKVRNSVCDEVDGGDLI